MASQPSASRQQLRIWILGILAAATLLTENFLDYPLGIPRFNRLAGGRQLLDLRFGYGTESVYELLDALGEAGRLAYLQLLWTVDVWLPFICALFLGHAIHQGRLRAYYWFPAVVAALDYAENTAITVLICSFPNRLPTLVLVSASLTILKYLSYATAIILAIAGESARIGPPADANRQRS